MEVTLKVERGKLAYETWHWLCWREIQYSCLCQCKISSLITPLWHPQTC